jgi:hypothetical protein
LLDDSASKFKPQHLARVQLVPTFTSDLLTTDRALIDQVLPAVREWRSRLSPRPAPSTTA